jgi:hypothetical protein
MRRLFHPLMAYASTTPAVAHKLIRQLIGWQ